MKEKIFLALLALIFCRAVVGAESEKDFWRSWVLKASSSEIVGHLNYAKLEMKSGCKDQNSIELRGTADEETAIELAKMMSAIAPDHLVTVVARSEHLAYVETRVNCAEEWMPGGLYAVFNFMQARTPGEKRWQVISISRWQN